MPESLVTALSLNRIQKTNQKFFFGNRNDVVRLDVVVNANNNGQIKRGQSSIQKIASFKPDQLKSFSSNVEGTIAQRKQSTRVREAEAALIREKVQEVRKQNPFARSGTIERQTGTKLNVLA